MNQLERAQSEAAFYKATDTRNFNTTRYNRPEKYAKDERIRVMYIHKDNIPQSLENDIVFYDNGQYKNLKIIKKENLQTQLQQILKL